MIDAFKPDREFVKALGTPDVTLHCGISGKSIQAHRLVLASISDRIRGYLADHDTITSLSSVDSTGVHLILAEMEFEVLRHILEFAYNGEARIPSFYADDICEVAHRLQIKYIKDSFVKINREDFEAYKSGKRPLVVNTPSNYYQSKRKSSSETNGSPPKKTRQDEVTISAITEPSLPSAKLPMEVRKIVLPQVVVSSITNASEQIVQTVPNEQPSNVQRPPIIPAVSVTSVTSPQRPPPIRSPPQIIGRRNILSKPDVIKVQPKSAQNVLVQSPTVKPMVIIPISNESAFTSVNSSSPATVETNENNQQINSKGSVPYEAENQQADPVAEVASNGKTNNGLSQNETGRKSSTKSSQNSSIGPNIEGTNIGMRTNTTELEAIKSDTKKKRLPSEANDAATPKLQQAKSPQKKQMSIQEHSMEVANSKVNVAANNSSRKTNQNNAGDNPDKVTEVKVADKCEILANKQNVKSEYRPNNLNGVQLSHRSRKPSRKYEQHFSKLGRCDVQMAQNSQTVTRDVKTSVNSKIGAHSLTESCSGPEAQTDVRKSHRARKVNTKYINDDKKFIIKSTTQTTNHKTDEELAEKPSKNNDAQKCVKSKTTRKKIPPEKIIANLPEKRIRKPKKVWDE